MAQNFFFMCDGETFCLSYDVRVLNRSIISNNIIVVVVQALFLSNTVLYCCCISSLRVETSSENMKGFSFKVNW